MLWGSRQPWSRPWRSHDVASAEGQLDDNDAGPGGIGGVILARQVRQGPCSVTASLLGAVVPGLPGRWTRLETSSPGIAGPATHGREV